MKKLFAIILGIIMVFGSSGTALAEVVQVPFEGTVAANTLEITAFDTLNGLDSSITLTPEVSYAELRIDDALAETIQNDGSGLYTVTKPAADVVTKIAKSTAKLVCYGANDIGLETVEKPLESKLARWEEAYSDPNGENGKSLMNPKDGANSYASYDSVLNAFKANLGNQLVPILGCSFFNLKEDSASNISEEAIVELSFRVKLSNTHIGFGLEPFFYSKVESRFSYGDDVSRPTIINSYADKASEFCNGTPVAADTWYTIKAVYDSINNKVEIFQGSEKIYSNVIKKNLTDNREYDYGLGNVKANLYQLSLDAESNGGYLLFDSVRVNRYRELAPGTATSYISYSNDEIACENGTVPTASHSVKALVNGLTGISAENVALYKDGTAVEASAAIAADAGGDTLTVTPTNGFEPGSYSITVNADAEYHNVGALGVPYTIYFEAVQEFDILSPRSGAQCMAGEMDVIVSDNNTTSVSLYANSILAETKNTDGSGLYTFKYTPTALGELKLCAVASFADGSSEEKEVTVNIAGEIVTYSEVYTSGSWLNFTHEKVASGNQFEAVVPAADDNVDGVGKRYQTINGNATLNSSGTSATELITTRTNTTENYVGKVMFEYDIKFDDVTKTTVGHTSATRLVSDTTTKWYPSPMNNRTFFNKGTITKLPASEGSYSYESNKWYRVNIEMDLRNMQQWVYITDVAAEETETLANGAMILKTFDGSYNEANKLEAELAFRQLQITVAQDAAPVGTGIVVANFSAKNVETIPTITAVRNVNGTDSAKYIKAADSAEVILSSGVFDDTLASHVTLKNDLQAVAAQIVYTKADKKLTVTPVGGFVANGRYTLEISPEATINTIPINIGASYDIFVTDSNGLFLTSGTAIASEGNEHTASVNYYNNGEEQSGILIIATYSGNKMTGISLSQERTIAVGEGSFTASITSKGIDTRVAAMLWNSLQDGVPLDNSADKSLNAG